MAKINEKAKFAIDLLKEYAEEEGHLIRATSDISPLEEWLIINLFYKDKKLEEATNIIYAGYENDPDFHRQAALYIEK